MFRKRHHIERSSETRKVFGLIYILLGIYFVSFKLSILTIPPLIENISQWIIAIGGIFLILSGINFLLPKKRKIIY